ncbi:MAG: hypothetical protein KME08_05690 [Aphanothece sp. CMT-3BRIN-NPC111]|jgi:hypothetical protein|nr:hypothetical protein [Aphanothece sp. CMT-3BRIN-NPC111]
MMSHFSPKSLAFYGVAIGSVVVLFNVVSAYGESKLKAPPAIDGDYRISAQNLPGCLKADELILTVQQSGQYLSGYLLPADKGDQKHTTAEEKPSLSGLWQNQQLNLSGSVPHLKSCNNSAAQTEASGSPSVNIEGRVQEKNLEGNIALSSVPGEVKFTAQQEAPVKQEKQEH